MRAEVRICRGMTNTTKTETKFTAIYRLTADSDEITRDTIAAIGYPQTLDEVVLTCRSLGVAATLTDKPGFTKGHVDADGAYRLA